MAQFYLDDNGQLTTKKKKKKETGTAPVKGGEYILNDDGSISPLGEDVLGINGKAENDSWFKSSDAFSDGWQPLDFDLTKTVLGTVGDAGINVLKGATNFGEGILDLGMYGASGISKILGADELSRDLKEQAQISFTDGLYKDVEDAVDRYSILGRRSDEIAQGIGYIGGMIGTAGIGGAAGLGQAGASALTTGATFTSAMGGGMTEAYQSGATDQEAVNYGIISGAGEAISEMIFGGLGKGFKALGIGKGLSAADDMLAKKLSANISNKLLKNLTQMGIKAGAEGLEEVAAGFISAAGKKATYMSEEDFGKLLTDEKLLDQFIAGAITSGIAQSGYVPGMRRGSLREANKTGRDFISGLTVNEQTVLDKEVEQRISEAEKDGKKLSKKERNALYDEAREDLEKGYISLDTIESTLGGETYSRYQTVTKQEEDLRKEIEELENMPREQITVKQGERLSEAREQLKALEEKNEKTALKKQLSLEVHKATENDTFLRESYNEKGRRGQAYEADLSKYDENQRKIIQAAIDSKILNNTRRTHEFVDLIARLSADKGLTIDFTNNEKLKNSQFAVEGKTVNGYITDKGVLGLNIQSSKSLNTVVGHEISHVLEGTDLYTALQEAVKSYAETKGEYASRLKDIESLYADQFTSDDAETRAAKYRAELTADLVGDYLFTDEDFVRHLSTNKGLFQRLFDEIKYLCKIATAGSKEAKQLEKVKRAFERAYQEERIQQRTETVNYALKDIATMSEKSYNHHGWAKVNDVMDDTETADFMQKVGDKAREGENWYLRLGENRHMFAVGHDGVNNILVISNGNFAEPSIEKVYRINLNNETDIEIVRDVIYESESDGGWSLQGNAIKEIFGPEIVSFNTAEDFGNYRETRRKYEGAEGKGNPGTNPGLQNRAGSNSGTKYSISNEAPSRDGAFLMVQDSNGRELTAKQQRYLKNVSPKLRDENGNIKRYYHGTARGDRVGTYFDPERATSGPMAFFTDDPTIAERYSKDKADTSMAYDSDYDSYETQFRVEINGNDMPLIDAWRYLPIDARKRIKDRAEHTHYDWDDYETLVYDENTTDAGGGFSWQLKEARGNVLRALNEQWLNSGNLFNQEGDYIDVLKFVGVFDELKKLGYGEPYYKDPNFRDEKVYEVYLNVTNPFDTADVDEEFLEDVRDYVDNTDLSIYETETADADLWDKRSIDPYDWIDRLERDIENGTTHAWTSIPDVITDFLKDYGGYDGIVDTGGKNTGYGHQVVIPFYSEQIKNIDNENPTRDPHINLSLSDRNTAPTGKWNVYGKDIALAPTAENDIVEKAKLFAEEAIKNKGRTSRKYNQHTIAAVPNKIVEAIYRATGGRVNVAGKKFAFEGGKLYHEIISHSNPKKEASLRQKVYSDADIDKIISTMMEPDIVEDVSSGDKLDNRNTVALAKEIDGEMVVIMAVGGKRNPSIVPEQIMWFSTEKWDELQSRGLSIAEAVYENTPNRMVSAEQAERSKKNRVTVVHDDPDESSAYTSKTLPRSPLGYSIPQSTEKSTENFSLGEDFSADAPVADDIAPVGGKQRKWVKTSTESDVVDGDILPEDKNDRLKTVDNHWTKASDNVAPEPTETIARVLTEEPKTEKQRNKRLWAIFKANVFDKGAVFEDLSLKTGNRELMGKWNYTLYSESRAQSLIGSGAPESGVKSLNDIRATVEGSGNAEDFYNYIYHKHNVDRMNLADRYEKAENKPVFGESVTSDVSQGIVDRYEAEHPEFMDYARDVYHYMEYLREQLVESGVIAQDTADLWAEMYPHYVPVRRVDSLGLNINVPLDTRRTGINAPVKKATGGNSDILPLFDTMAMRTMQTYRATAKNSFGVELKNTLGTEIESAKAGVDEVIDSVGDQEELLQKGKNGRYPTFTVFENGEKITFEITEDMYDAFRPVSDSSILSKTIPGLGKMSNIHRGLLTEYNPVFMLTNAIKDTQDILLNSQHFSKTYAKIPEAFRQIKNKGYWYQEYMKNGGEQNSYFDKDTNTFKTESTGLSALLQKPPFNTISRLNNYIEMIPRLSEYIASREMGASIEVAMLDSARVTTNFKAGGDLVKWANRNGATFLNASVQGAMQQVRNIREAKANGVKGWVNLATKFAIAGLPAVILNAMLWDDDEDYAELSDYVKQSYYVVGKDDNGNFIRIPKGRTLAVIQEALTQIGNVVTGNDEADLAKFIDLVITNLAPNNPLEDNILAPIIQVANNKTWYGGDLVSKRLQNLPASEQYDESTDSFSKWLGGILNVSPVKINYLLDQYSGGVGDVVLPMMTPEAESGDDSLIGNIIAPMKNKFVTDGVMNNQNISDIYETSDELTVNANKAYATDEDVLKNKYINSIKAEMNTLYQQKRELQNSDLPASEKYAQVRLVQDQINELAKEGLNEYPDVTIDGDYAFVGDRQYRRGTDGEWQKITDQQVEKQKSVSDLLDIAPSVYWNNKDEYDYAYSNPEKYALSQAVGGYEAFSSYNKAMSAIESDKNSAGKTITGSRKRKVIEYLNGLDIDYGEKLLLFKSQYTADDTYNMEIVEYLNNRNDISYQAMKEILELLGFTVDKDGNITW